MTSRDFCYWLQGFFEVSNQTQIYETQVQQIRNHLNLVFQHEIDPKVDQGDARIGAVLQSIHDNKIPSASLADIKLRC
jgi:hypothetical protein